MVIVIVEVIGIVLTEVIVITMLICVKCVFCLSFLVFCPRIKIVRMFHKSQGLLLRIVQM